MVQVYCYAKCTTCKKAIKWLDDKGVEYESIDIKGEHPLRRFFNTSGMLYREMELSKKLPDMSEDEMFKILASDGMLVKRPLLVTDSKAVPGFKEELWSEELL